jgi:hypothetical protein
VRGLGTRRRAALSPASATPVVRMGERHGFLTVLRSVGSRGGQNQSGRARRSRTGAAPARQPPRPVSATPVQAAAPPRTVPWACGRCRRRGEVAPRTGGAPRTVASGVTGTQL